MADKDATIKKAVKEALDDKRLDDLAKQMTDLATQMAAGFAASHARHDTANGKLIRNENEITKLNERMNNQVSWKSWLMPTLTALLTGLAVYIITH